MTPERSTWAVTAVCAVAWLYVFPYFPRLNNPNENVRLYMTAAIAEDGSYRIDDMRRRWGGTSDAACVDRFGDGRIAPCEPGRPPPGAERHYYSVKAPGISLLGVPFYWVYHRLAGEDLDRTVAVWILRVFANILPLLAFVFFFHRWMLRRFAPRVAHLSTLGMVLGTCVLAYGYLFVSHSLSAAAAFGGFALIGAQREGRGTHLHAALAGFLTASASLLEYPCFLVSAVLGVFALTMPRARWLPFAAGALVPTLAMMHFQWFAYGNPLTPGHLYVENPAARAVHEMGLFGAHRFHPDAAWRLLFDLRLGLLAQSPWLALFPVGLVIWWRQRRAAEVLTLGLAVGLLFVAVCCLENWEGGWVVGPRYLVALYPLLAIPTAVAIQGAVERFESRRAVVLGVAFGAVLVGVLTAGLASMYYPHLPPQLDHPLPQLVAPLIAEGYAPYTAANLFGITGTPSMVLAFVAIAIGFVAAATDFRPPGRLPGAAAAAFAATVVVLLAPHLLGAAERAETWHAITSIWTPAPD